jgi:hypothetical protein
MVSRIVAPADTQTTIKEERSRGQVAVLNCRMTLGTIVVSWMLVGVAPGVVSASARGLSQFAQNADTFELAACGERGATPVAEHLARVVADHGLGQAPDDCGNLSSRARLTAALAAPRTATREGADGRIEAGEEEAIRAGECRLRGCPLGENSRLRYAIVAAEAPTPGVGEDVRMPYLPPPVEVRVFVPRLDLATRLFAAGASGFFTQYSAVVRRFGSLPASSPAMAVHVVVRARSRPYIEFQPDPRNPATVAKIDRLGLDFNWT